MLMLLRAGSEKFHVPLLGKAIESQCLQIGFFRFHQSDLRTTGFDAQMSEIAARHDTTGGSATLRDQDASGALLPAAGAAAAASPEALARRSPSGAPRRPNREPTRTRWQVASQQRGAIRTVQAPGLCARAGWVRGRCQRPCPAGSSPPLPPPFLCRCTSASILVARCTHTHTHI